MRVEVRSRRTWANFSLAAAEPWRLEVTFAAVALLYLAPIPQSMALNILDLTTSLVDHGSIVLDEFAGTDVALRDGRILSGMPPGASFHAAALYMVARPALGRLPAGTTLPVLYVLCTLLLAIPAALLTMRLVYRLTRGWGATHRNSLLTAALLAFGTMHFGYATGFYKKTLAAAYLMGAFSLLSSPEVPKRPGRAALAGVFCGLAIGLDYPAALIACVLTGYGLWRRPRLAALAAFLAGGGGALLPVLAYHQAAFGSPWLTAYQFRSEPAGNALGVPRLGPLLFLISTCLAASPCLVWAGSGWIRKFRAGEQRAELLAIAAIALGGPLFFSAWSSFYPHDASFPSRLLLPVLPFAVLPMAFGLPPVLRYGSKLVIGWSVGSSVLAAQACLIPTETIPPLYALKVLATSWGTGPLFSEVLPSWLGLSTLHLAVARGTVHAVSLLHPESRDTLLHLLRGQALVKLISLTVTGATLGLLWCAVWRPVLARRSVAVPPAPCEPNGAQVGPRAARVAVGRPVQGGPQNTGRLARWVLAWRFRHLAIFLGTGLLLTVASSGTRRLGLGVLIVTWLTDYLAYRVRAAHRGRAEGLRVERLCREGGSRRFYREGQEHTLDPPHAAIPLGDRPVTAVSPAHALRAERVNRLLRRLAAPTPRRHLDLGCKDGLVSAAMAGRGVRMIGVDLDGVALRQVARNSGALAVVADVTCLPFTGACTETVSLLEVLEHLEDPGTALREAARVVRPDGTVLLTTNNRSAVLLDYLANPLILVERCLGLFFPRLLPPAGLVWEDRCRGWAFYHTEFSRPDLLALLRDAGLRPVILETYFFAAGLEHWMARLRPRLTEGRYCRWAAPVERVLGRLPLLGWLGGNWLVAARLVGGGPCPSRGSCTSP
jgi:SAM-dependent methyltransferase